MSSIHYKFRSSLEYDTLTFDGPSISLSDLRDAIIQQKKIGKSSDFTLEVTNAQTKEVYHDPTMQVPRNTSVVVKRVPVARLAAVTGKIIDPEAKEVCKESSKYVKAVSKLLSKYLEIKRWTSQADS